MHKGALRLLTPARPRFGRRLTDASVTSVLLANGRRLSISWRDHSVVCGDRAVALTLREIQLLAALVENAGLVIGKEELACLAWRHDGNAGRLTAVHISTLRRKLAWFGSQFGIRTIRGAGYRFEAAR